jgi:hypothetical protein
VVLPALTSAEPFHANASQLLNISTPSTKIPICPPPLMDFVAGTLLVRGTR